VPVGGFVWSWRWRRVAIGSVAEVLGLRLLRPFPLSFLRAVIEAVRLATMAWMAAILVALLVVGAATALAAYSLTTGICDVFQCFVFTLLRGTAQ